MEEAAKVSLETLQDYFRSHPPAANASNKYSYSFLLKRWPEPHLAPWWHDRPEKVRESWFLDSGRALSTVQSPGARLYPIGYCRPYCEPGESSGPTSHQNRHPWKFDFGLARNYSIGTLLLVPRGGLEPPRPCGLRILSPLRLPISPSGLWEGAMPFAACLRHIK